MKFLWQERGFFRKGWWFQRTILLFKTTKSCHQFCRGIEQEQRRGKRKVSCTFAESEMSSQNGDRYSNSPARIKSKSSSWSWLKWKMMISAQNWTQCIDEEILFWTIRVSKWCMILCKVKPSKWRESAKENVCNYSSCPDINLKTIPTNKKITSQTTINNNNNNNNK